MIARLLQIQGRVQGVGYRYSMEVMAEQLGLVGWVRNRFDGTVEAHAEGTEEQVRALIEWAHTGPPGADVTHVLVQDATAEGFAEFGRRPTA
ncbi:MAG: acylphosphatase [Burkholderiales bacterium]|nr:acylphosphatase [Burkholderiales bacterium]